MDSELLIIELKIMNFFKAIKAGKLLLDPPEKTLNNVMLSEFLFCYMYSGIPPSLVPVAVPDRKKYSLSSRWYQHERITEKFQKVARHSSYKKRLEQRCIH
jgi:hypothetical protein